MMMRRKIVVDRGFRFIYQRFLTCETIFAPFPILITVTFSTQSPPTPAYHGSKISPSAPTPITPCPCLFLFCCPSCLSSLLVSPCIGFPRPLFTSADVAPPSESAAEVAVLSSSTASSRRAVLGAKVRSSGALPAGRVSAWYSGIRSLPTRTPGWCWRRDFSWREGWRGEWKWE